MQISKSCQKGFHVDCIINRWCDCDCHNRCKKCNKYCIDNKYAIFDENRQFTFYLCQNCFKMLARCYICNQYVGVIDNDDPYYIKDGNNEIYRFCNNCWNKWEKKNEARN